jgi:ketosteroid isomerase-like protein
MRRGPAALVAAVAIAGAALAWFLWPGDSAAIHGRLAALSTDLNAAGGTGLAGAAQAAQIGRHFTEDVVIDLGPAAAKVEGRTTLVGMFARLERRTSEFTVRFLDATIRERTDSTASVSLTAEIRSRSASQEAWMDAREFSVSLRQEDGEWRIARVQAVETIR